MRVENFLPSKRFSAKSNVYKLIFSRDALKAVNKLDPVTKKRLGKKLQDYSRNPLRHVKRLIDPKIGSYRWRIGNYRVIFDIKGKNIKVLQVGHRREIYR